MEFIKSNLKCVEIMQSSRTSYFLNTFGCVFLYKQEKIQEQYAGHGRGFLIQFLESVYRFGLGSVAGGNIFILVLSKLIVIIVTVITVAGL